MTELPQIQNIESLYFIEDAETVLSFLNQHPPLMPLLIEAYEQVEAHFGARQRVTLEWVADPEIAGFDELFAYIVTTLPASEAYEKFIQFRDDWFLERVDQADYLLNFSLQLR
jgi:hypothetical protein